MKKVNILFLNIVIISNCFGGEYVHEHLQEHLFNCDHDFFERQFRKEVSDGLKFIPESSNVRQYCEARNLEKKALKKYGFYDNTDCERVALYLSFLHKQALNNKLCATCEGVISDDEFIRATNRLIQEAIINKEKALLEKAVEKAQNVPVHINEDGSVSNPQARDRILKKYKKYLEAMSIGIRRN